jgi:hypothetical protein
MSREWALNDKCEVVVSVSGKKYTARSAVPDALKLLSGPAGCFRSASLAV